MIYLTTGGNGAGKTLLTLKDVRALQLKDNRPVYYTERFKLVADFGWIPFKFEDWQLCPDGAILLCDEVQYDLPLRPGKEPPPHIQKLSEHRSRGFDFFLITQHPANIDIFVRRLIASPGWHRHLKRASGASLVSVITFTEVNTTCEKPGSGASGQVAMTPYPKEVYSWYVSTSLDTAKLKIPFQVKALIGAMVLFPALVYFGWSSFKKSQPGLRDRSEVVAAAPVGGTVPGNAGNGVAVPLTAAQYVATYVPRVEGLPHTAPRYDELTKPVNVPTPAACLSMGDRCNCYTKQATRLEVTVDLCRQIVKGGYFDEFTPPATARSVEYRPPQPSTDRPVLVSGIQDSKTK